MEFEFDFNLISLIVFKNRNKMEEDLLADFYFDSFSRICKGQGNVRLAYVPLGIRCLHMISCKISQKNLRNAEINMGLVMK